MKIYLMTDMEGVSGVANHDDWVVPGGKYYDDGKKMVRYRANKGTPAYVGYANHDSDVAALINRKAERASGRQEGRYSK